MHRKLVIIVCVQRPGPSPIHSTRLRVQVFLFFKMSELMQHGGEHRLCAAGTRAASLQRLISKLVTIRPRGPLEV